MSTRILIVEDESLLAKDIQGMLSALGYDVCGVAVSGEQAIQKAKEGHPNLVLMDIELKGDLDGVDTAAYIHEYFHVPVVYITALADDKTLDRIKFTQPSGILIKPFGGVELNGTIESVLHKQKSMRMASE
jgi:CheY-like chemotaxis protein